jgi:putative transposase
VSWASSEPLRRRFRSRFEAELAIVEYLGWFNDVRLHSEIGDVPPSELEAEYLRPLSLRRREGTTHPSLYETRGGSLA